MTRAVITEYDNIRYLLIYEKNSLAECHPLVCDDTFQIGSIYIGRVEKVVKNIQSAFIRLDNDHVGYLPLNDLPAKVLNRTLPKGLISIAESDKILVQVEQEPQKMKQARVTGNVSLSGLYVAMDMLKDMVGVSNKIKDQKRAEQLKRLVENMDIPYGIVFRTSCEDAEDEAILREVQDLKEKMDNILHKAQYQRNTGLLSSGKPSYLAILEEYGWMRIDEVQTDIPKVYDTLVKIGDAYSHNLIFYHDDYPLFKLLGLEKELSGLLNKRVWLKSGGFLVIEPTEAMVVIDVNTGKSIGRKKQEDHILKVNEEAAIEIAKQLRLRNLSGMILVDFINMQQQSNCLSLIRTLRQELKKDKVPTKFIDVTELQLYEITRKKIRKPLHEILQ